MRVHLTCAAPTRSLVLTLHAAREVLVLAGHRVCLAWEERLGSEAGAPVLGFDEAALAAAEAIVHVAGPDTAPVPDAIARACRGGKPLVVLVPSGATPARMGAEVAIDRVDGLLEALARACAVSVG